MSTAFPDSDDFVPPYPARLPDHPSTLTRLDIARRNFLGIWEDSAFDLELTVGQILSRRIFVFNSPRGVQFAFNQNNASFERKSPQMRHALRPLLGDGLFISDGEVWRQRRKLVSPVVHASQMARFAPVMVEAAVETRQRWSAAEGREIDVLQHSAHLTAEIICRTVFGRELGRQHAAAVVDGFSEYQRVVGQVDLPSLLGLPDWMPRFQSGRARRAIARIHAVLDEIIGRLQANRGRDDTSMIASLLDATDDSGSRLSAEALRNEAAVLFMAGHETTANLLTWTWYLLSQAPRARERLHAELDAVLQGRLPGLADVPRLVFTRALLDEALRLYPPVPILPREAMVEQSFEGQHIPKGSLVLVVPWLLHRHRKLWREPDRFAPERFLAGSPEPVSKYAYVPFSIGPRICAGLTFGIVEATLCLATLAQAFDLALRPGYRVEPVARLTLRPEGGLPMMVRRRQPSPVADRAAPSAARAGTTAAQQTCPVRHEPS